MRKPDVIGGLIFAAFLLSASGAQAGPWEDGMAAYNRGDYLPAIRLFRPLAENGNRKAQNVIGAMYSKGEGVQRNLQRFAGQAVEQVRCVHTAPISPVVRDDAGDRGRCSDPSAARELSGTRPLPDRGG